MSDNTTITPLELKRRIDEGGVDFLFDLRNHDEYQSWHIEGHSEIPSLNLPQPDFIGEEEKHLHLFPKGKKILTVCAHGDSSKYTAELLREKGYDAVGLAGGMEAWSELYIPKKISESPLIYQVNRTARGCLAYVIIAAGEAVIIDASRHLAAILELVASHKARITRVIDTHLHADHISGGPVLSKEHGAPYHVDPRDAAGVSYPIAPLADGERFALGPHVFEALHTPGHTPGSTSFLLDGRFLFTGDTIMKSSVGRPDLGGQAEAWGLMLYDTLFKKLAPLPGEILILPAHSVPVADEDAEGIVGLTLGEARRHLDLFQECDPETFVRRVHGSLLENPERYQEIRNVNLGFVSPDEAKRKELEIGKNLCGMGKAR